MLFAATSAHATLSCTGYRYTGNAISAGRVIVSPSVAVGTTVANPPMAFPVADCSGGTGGEQVTFTIHTSSALAAGFNDVYQTNIPGIGIRYQVTPRCVGSTSPATLANNGIQSVCTLPSGVNNGLGWNVYPSLVVTGAIPAGGTVLTTVPTVVVGWQMPGQAEQALANFYTGAASGTIVTPACTVTETAQSVGLPRVLTSSMASGVGAVAGTQSFSLSFTCSAGANVYMTLSDAVNPVNRTTTLALASDSTAKGVGIQVLNTAGSPVTFGADSSASGNPGQWLIGASVNGPLNVPLSARYIRTGTVSAGSVKALATLTMSYQ
ncbi:fimbrial protein [Paraburkholderia agricolaris]|uniref:fimbrial protein n=1 Tax=Paraburkholderia agricolaris TaxID=2152888 RepID=UPI001FE8BC09|nr:fimbrial protein [Paraburkholderia agricolaris]